MIAVFVCLLSVSSTVTAVHAQQSPTTAPTDSPLTIEKLQSERERLLQRADLTEAQRREIDDLLKQANDALVQADASQQAAVKFERERSSAPSELEQVKAELAKPLDSKITVGLEATVEQLRPQKEQADANLALLTQRMKAMVDQETETTARRQAITTDTARLQQELQDTTAALQTLAASPAEGVPAEVADAQRLSLQAKRQFTQQQLLTLSAETARNDARAELVKQQKELATRQLAALETIAKAWRDELAKAESRQAAEAAAAARRTEAESHPAVREIARRNVELLELLSGTSKSSPGLVANRAKAQDDLDTLRKQLRLISERLDREVRIGEASGLTEVVDVRLRRMRGDLPNPAVHRENIARRRLDFTRAQQKLADVQYEHDMQLDDQSRLRTMIQGLDPTISEDTRAEITRQMEEQLARQNELFDSLTVELTTYSDLLVEVQQVETRLVQLVDRFHAYIGERILWLRSMSAIGRGEVRSSIVAETRWFAPTQWKAVLLTLWRDATTETTVIGGWAMVFLGLFVLKRRVADRLRRIAGLVPQVYTDRFIHTVNAFVITVLLAAFWPGVMWFIAWRLSANAQVDDVLHIYAAALNRAGVIAFTLQFHRQLCKPFGLGEAHFRWRDGTRRVLRIGLFWLTIIEVPMAFIITACETANNDPGTSQLGRLAFIVAMLTAGIVIGWMLHPRRDLLSTAFANSGWLQHLRWSAYLLITTMPLALAATAAIGYYYTALQLERRLVATLWLTLALIVFNGLILRWLLIAKRRLAIDEARKRKAAAGETATPSSGDGADANLVLNEPKLDLNAVNAQTRQLLRSAIWFGLFLGVWFIWIDLLPALNILKRVELWPDPGIRNAATLEDEHTDWLPLLAPIPATPATATPAPAPSVAGAATASLPSAPAPISIASSALTGSPAASTASADPPRRILTLSDVALALLVLIITIVVSKNIPGLLEITLLQRLPLEPSGRYAVSTIARYVLSIVGSILAFNAIGIGWTQVQWLAAAITLGIGFGLQEIFANFISGIIILFEQPIRVGDTVTVNNIDGTVTRIRMRATTITDYDRKEIIIPNKAFITGQIVNWTLSDNVQRLVFNLGVAYSSDTALVERTLMDIARSHPNVLADPPPHVVFTRFADSSLEFSLRVYIGTLDHLLTVRHEINQRINEAFTKAGISMAYPQRDLHIRSLPPRPVRPSRPPPPPHQDT